MWLAGGEQNYGAGVAPWQPQEAPQCIYYSSTHQSTAVRTLSWVFSLMSLLHFSLFLHTGDDIPFQNKNITKNICWLKSMMSRTAKFFLHPYYNCAHVLPWGQHTHANCGKWCRSDFDEDLASILNKKAAISVHKVSN